MQFFAKFSTTIQFILNRPVAESSYFILDLREVQKALPILKERKMGLEIRITDSKNMNHMLEIQTVCV